LQMGDLRVLGVLLEKEQTTPEYYPMSLKAVVAGCNQKNNREPVMSMSEQEALNVLRVLTQEGLATMEFGARVDRWRHNVDTLLKFRSAPKALLTELLLRGPQTPGELKARCERMHPFPSLAQVEEQLRELATGEDRLIYRLPRQPGQKEERWVIGLEGEPPLFEPDVVSRIPSAAHALEERLAILEGRVDELQAEVGELRQRLSDFNA
jgi:uncharacterized protein